MEKEKKPRQKFSENYLLRYTKRLNRYAASSVMYHGLMTFSKMGFQKCQSVFLYSYFSLNIKITFNLGFEYRLTEF